MWVSMAKVLVISAHFPAEKAPYAGHKTAYGFLKTYLDNGDSVDLIVVSNADEKREIGLESHPLFRLVDFYKLNAFRKVLNILRAPSWFPLKAATRYDHRLARKLHEIAPSYDTIHFEFTHAAVYLCAHPEFLGQHTSVSSHDVLLQAALRQRIRNPLRRLIHGIDALSTFYFEKSIYDKVENIWVQSQKDRQLLESVYSIHPAKIQVKAPSLSPFLACVVEKRRHHPPEPKTLLFWGAMNRPENEEAVLTFWGTYGDQLIRKGYRLLIVGINPGPSTVALASSHVEVTGFVEDPSDYFVRASVGIVPLATGAGIKVKTLEMLAAGLPVVSTPIGAEGIAHERLQVCDFKDFVCEIEKISR